MLKGEREGGAAQQLFPSPQPCLQGTGAVRERAGLSVEKLLWLRHRYQGVNKGWTCALQLRKSERRTEGNHKKECMKPAPCGEILG